MVVLELEAIYAQAAPHTKLLNKRFVGAHHWLGPLKEALVARLAADKVRTRFTCDRDFSASRKFRVEAFRLSLVIDATNIIMYMTRDRFYIAYYVRICD